MDKEQPRSVISRIDDRRVPCVNGHGRCISCAFRRMLMRLMVPSRGRNAAGSRLVRLRGGRDVPYTTAPFEEGCIRRAAQATASHQGRFGLPDTIPLN